VIEKGPAMSRAFFATSVRGVKRIMKRQMIRIASMLGEPPPKTDFMALIMLMRSDPSLPHSRIQTIGLQL
jgi:hypothetical protein